MITEETINRVRVLVGFGMTIAEVAATCTDLSREQVWLAYHAARVIDGAVAS